MPFGQYTQCDKSIFLVAFYARHGRTQQLQKEVKRLEINISL